MSRSSLTDIPFNLFCLVEGKPMSRTFSVKVSSADTVHDLKDAIKAEKSPEFDDIDANKLNLWRVEIPYSEDDALLMRDSVIEKAKLAPITRLSKLFPKEISEDTIHIMVQRPLFNARKISLPREQGVPELLRIIEKIRPDHHSHSVDVRAAERFQRDKLGCFYKKLLPYAITADSIYLQMLGNMLNEQPQSAYGETLINLVERDFNKNTDLGVVALVGRSGAGKTATVIELAKKHFVIYILCTDPAAGISPGFRDTNFVKLAIDVGAICARFPKTDPLENLIDNDARMKALVQERVEIEFLARLLFLKLLFVDNPELTPEQFFREQINGGVLTVSRLRSVLIKYDGETIRCMREDLRADIVENHLNKHQKKRGLAIALDEAQIAGHNILPRRFLAAKAVRMSIENLVDHKNRVRGDFQRGFITPLCAQLCDVGATLIVLGTSLSLQDADNPYSSICKKTNFTRILRFPCFNERNQQEVLSEIIDVSDCGLPPAKRRKLTGRARFTVNVVTELLQCPDIKSNSKQQTLDKAFDSAIKTAKEDIERSIQQLINDDKTGEITRLLSRMVLADKLHKGKISFASTRLADFVDKSLCSLRSEYYDFYYVMDEPLVVEVAEEELKMSNVDPVFVEYLDQFNRLIENLGVNATAKGDMLEPLVRRALQRFNGFDLADLPFLKGTRLPTWCNGLKLQIDEINTARGFGYNENGIRADLEFLKARPTNKMLIEGHGISHDGAWFFNNHYAGTVAIKLCTQPMAEAKHEHNENSSDIRCSFLRYQGISSNPSLEQIRGEFEASGVPSDIKGMLRIHLELPSVSGCRPTTYVKMDPTTGNEDIMVYIDSLNMDKFFYEGISEHVEEIRIFKRLLKYVIGKP
ncbi:hypothetical protein EC973_004960 [Apophysomyces ossiformis]|uniref:Crinkler effector protein N-terminal domain-containing protein n=1 Tax=Apophysomyces ossiformis TaxID=679940 RepID=A0A8H7BHR6_9FUNG|nr:hypothetical protein EC973_004960 [Apophysomyces ossiformis]